MRKEQSEEEASKEEEHVFKFGIPFLYVLLVGLVAVDFFAGTWQLLDAILISLTDRQ